MKKSRLQAIGEGISLVLRGKAGRMMKRADEKKTRDLCSS